jgi:hypothetical protein
LGGKVMKAHAIQIAISLLACVLLVAHLICPGLKIDAITLTLFGMAIVPWLGSIFRSLEMPGGWKFEFKDFAKAVTNAEASGLLAPKKVAVAGQIHSDATYSALFDAYPRLAIIGLRVDIEKRLRKLSDQNGITDQKASATTLTRQLAKLQVLTGPESVALLGILASLNPVVHGAEITPADAEQVMKVGKRLIDSLDERLQSTEAQGR